MSGRVRRTHAYRACSPAGVSPISPGWKVTPLWDEIGRIRAKIKRLSSLLLKLQLDADRKLAGISDEDLCAT